MRSADDCIAHGNMILALQSNCHMANSNEKNKGFRVTTNMCVYVCIYTHSGIFPSSLLSMRRNFVYMACGIQRDRLSGTKRRCHSLASFHSSLFQLIKN